MTKSHVGFHFDHLDLTDGMVPLMTPLASCDTDTSVNGITWPKCYVAHCFNALDLMNTVVLMTVPLSSYDADASGKKYQMTEKVMLLLILIICTNKCIDAIDDAISVMWCQHWHHMMKRVMSHLVSIVFTLWTKWHHCWSSHDSSADTGCITWLKMSCFTTSWSLWPYECNGTIDKTSVAS